MKKSSMAMIAICGRKLGRIPRYVTRKVDRVKPSVWTTVERVFGGGQNNCVFKKMIPGNPKAKNPKAKLGNVRIKIAKLTYPDEKTQGGIKCPLDSHDTWLAAKV